MPLLQYKDFTKTEFEQSHGGRPCLVQGVPEAEGWLCREKWRSEGRFLKHYADMHIPVTEMAPLMGKTRKLNVSLEQYVAYAASNEVALSRCCGVSCPSPTWHVSIRWFARRVTCISCGYRWNSRTIPGSGSSSRSGRSSSTTSTCLSGSRFVLPSTVLGSHPRLLHPTHSDRTTCTSSTRISGGCSLTPATVSSSSGAGGPGPCCIRTPRRP